MKNILLDLVQETWWQRNERDVIVLSIMGVVAVAALAAMVIWVRKRKLKQ
ncbi:MAG: hypothetical protein JST86_16945 [Bacteroidetes bacterium]|nr:hypothetical protein [Bacteroidota bacterium]